MVRQGFSIDLNGDTGTAGWAASFLKDRPVGSAPDVVGTAAESTQRGAAQRAVLEALKEA